MFSGLFKSALSNNLSILINRASSIEAIVNSVASYPEKDINQALVNQLVLFNQSLGTISYKGLAFSARLRTEIAMSHGRICQMHLPLPNNPKKGTELGDVIVAVDYILIDPATPKTKVVNGGASIIQTKKESYARNGINAAQLYLMTQWPRLDFRERTWKFDVLSDVFAFYFFVLDCSSTVAGKTSIVSAPMLAKYLGADKNTLISGITGNIPFSSPNLLYRDQIGISTMPLSLTEYILRSLYLTIGSSSVRFRAMLKKEFFHYMEEVEDCQLAFPPINKKIPSKEIPDFPEKLLKLDEDEEGDIFAVRIKLILGGIG